MAAIARPRHAACRAGPGARAALRMSPPLPAGYLGPLPGSPTREGPRLTGRWGKRIADLARLSLRGCGGGRPAGGAAGVGLVRLGTERVTQEDERIDLHVIGRAPQGLGRKAGPCQGADMDIARTARADGRGPGRCSNGEEAPTGRGCGGKCFPPGAVVSASGSSRPRYRKTRFDGGMLAHQPDCLDDGPAPLATVVRDRTSSTTGWVVVALPTSTTARPCCHSSSRTWARRRNWSHTAARSSCVRNTQKVDGR